MLNCAFEAELRVRHAMFHRATHSQGNTWVGIELQGGLVSPRVLWCRGGIKLHLASGQCRTAPLGAPKLLYQLTQRRHHVNAESAIHVYTAWLSVPL